MVPVCVRDREKAVSLRLPPSISNKSLHTSTGCVGGQTPLNTQTGANIYYHCLHCGVSGGLDRDGCCKRCGQIDEGSVPLKANEADKRGDDEN